MAKPIIYKESFIIHKDRIWYGLPCIYVDCTVTEGDNATTGDLVTKYLKMKQRNFIFKVDLLVQSAAYELLNYLSKRGKNVFVKTESNSTLRSIRALRYVQILANTKSPNKEGHNFSIRDFLHLKRGDYLNVEIESEEDYDAVKKFLQNNKSFEFNLVLNFKAGDDKEKTAQLDAVARKCAEQDSHLFLMPVYLMKS